MSPIDALKSAAAMTQSFWGIGENLGTSEKDKLADIIAVPREPTADITPTKRVFRHEEGRIIRQGPSGTKKAEKLASPDAPA